MTLTDAESRLVRRWLVILIGAGVLWRLVRFAIAMPIWGDEAMLGLSMIGRSYRELLQPLQSGQVAPLGFLWVLRLAFDTLGVSDYTTRLPALVAGIAALFLFWPWARVVVREHVAMLATGIVAVSWYMVRHGVEMKPYAFDLLASVMLLLLTTNYLMARRPAWLVGLIVAAPVCALISYPQIFVAAGVAVALLWSARNASARDRVLVIVYCAIAAGSWGLVFAASAAGQYQISKAALQNYWANGFPPGNPLKFLGWFVQIHTGNLFAYPVGGKNGASIVTVALFGLGLITTWRTWNTTTRLMLFTPFLFTFVAAALRLYPYGESARVSQHLAPVIILLTAAGIGRLVDAAATRRQWSFRLQLAATALLVIASVSIVLNVLQPYKTEADYKLRADVRHLLTAAGNSPVIVLQPAAQLPPTLRWYLNERAAPVEYAAAIPAVPSAAEAYVVNTDRNMAGLATKLASETQMKAETWLREDLQLGPREGGPSRLEIVRLTR